MKTTSIKLLAALAATAALAAAPFQSEARPVGGPGYSHGGGGWNHGYYGGYYGGYRGGWGGYRGWGPGYYWGGIGLGLGLASIAYASGPYYGYGGYGGYYAYPGYAAPVTEYVVVEPAPGDRVMRSGGQPVPSQRAPDPIFYPKSGQTPAKTEADRQECNRWATTQAGAMSDASIFQRATYACMEGRGYTVK